MKISNRNRVGYRKWRIIIFLGICISLAAGYGPGQGATTSHGVTSSQLTNEPEGDWLRRVQENARLQEYKITWQENTPLPGILAAYQAPNRSQNLRTYFTEQGMTMVARQDSGWRLDLALEGISASGHRQLAGKHTTNTKLFTAGDRIEYSSREAGSSNIAEWYQNTPEGLKQGFILFEDPYASGVQETGEVSIHLSASGNLTPTLKDESNQVEWEDSSGERILHFEVARASDAKGRWLPVTLSLGGEVPSGNSSLLRISIDGRGAVYPILVMPIITSLSTTANWTGESNQANAAFGYSVDTAGDVNGDGYSDVIVGAYWYDNGQANEGKVYVYHGSASGLSLTPAWNAEGNQANALFGSQVNTAGDVNGDGFADVVVGAREYDGGENNEGKVFLYHGSVGGLGLSPAWTAESNQADAHFGSELASAGDVNNDGYSDVVIGAELYNDGFTDEGKAFAWYGSASGLGTNGTPLNADWSAKGNQLDARFGNGVDGAGDVDGDGYDDVLVGAYRYSSGEANEGKAFLYYGSDLGLENTAGWTAESNQASATLGSPVSVIGDINGDGYADVAIGAGLYDNGQADEGAVFVWHGSASGPGANGTPANADWMAESDQAGARLGWSAAPAGDVNGDGFADLIAGAYLYDNGQADEGEAYVWFGSNTGFGTNGSPGNADWRVQADQNVANFGYSVSTAGDVNGDGFSDPLVGAPGYSEGQATEGAAFVYYGSADGIAPTHSWLGEGGQAITRYGISSGTAGDVNGDGYSDVIVGAPYYDNGQNDEGAVFVYYGSPTGLNSSGGTGTADWMAEGNQLEGSFGWSVAAAGDVNGDGYGDIIVGARFINTGPVSANEGWVFVWYGSATGLGDPGTPANADWRAESNQYDAEFGTSVGTAGDVNGDGYADVIAGAPYYDSGNTDEGAAYVWFGSASGLGPNGNPGNSDWTAQSDQDYANLGYSVGTAGDVNGDGFSDVIVGARYYDHDEVDEGTAFVWLGSANGLGLDGNPQTAQWRAESDQVGARMGEMVASAGDVNGDGFSDVMVGAGGYDGGQANEGRVFAYHGSASGLSDLPNWIAENNRGGSVFGATGGSAGDVNGDGYSDVVLGAYYYASGQLQEGKAYAYHGSPSGLNSTPAWSFEPDQAWAQYGFSAGTAGDVNGDGYSDIIVGAAQYTNGDDREGGAFLYYGNLSDGLDFVPQQLRTDGSTPVAPMGKSDSPTEIILSLIGRTPLGRGDVKLQWQVAPLGTLFGAPGTIMGTSSSWRDTDTAGWVFVEDAGGLDPFSEYHWRVRLLYEPGNRHGQSASRWISLPWNAWEETDFHTVTCVARLNNSPTDYSTVQDAVEASTQPSDVVKVSGYCSGVNNQGGLSQTVYVDKSLTIRGGYTSGWTTPTPGAYSTLDALGLGRGIYVTAGSTVTLENLRVVNGDANGLGGGSSGLLDGGGGIYVDASTATLQNMIVLNNTADEGGGVFLRNTSSTVQSSQISTNQATNGGGIFIWQNSPIIQNNHVSGNEASRGGGLYAYQSTPQITANTITANTAGPRGGGLTLSYSNASLVNNFVGNNLGNLGSGIDVVASSPSLVHTTLGGNNAGEGVGGNGVDVIHDAANFSTVSLVNTILVSHTVGISVTLGSTANLNGTLWGNGTDWTGGGTINRTANVFGSAGFIGPGSGNFHILPTSDAIDAGVNSGIATDIDGEARPNGGVYDIGADEYTNITPVATDDDYTIEEDNPAVLHPLDNDSDPNGDPLTITSVSTPDHGSANTDGVVINYTPPIGFEGLATFTYSISDGQGGTDSATIRVTVVNVAPVLGILPDKVVVTDEVMPVSGTFTDPGTTDSHTVFIDWGDGSTTSLNLALGQRSFNTNHVYSEVGVYTVVVTVSDDDGGQGEGTFRATVNQGLFHLYFPVNRYNSD